MTVAHPLSFHCRTPRWTARSVDNKSAALACV